MSDIITYISSSSHQKGSSVWENTNKLFRSLRRRQKPRGEDSCDALIKAGVDLHAKGFDGGTLLTVAVHMSTVKNAESLIKSGADVNAQTTGLCTSPLLLAARSNKMKMLCMLLAYGADVNLANRAGHIPLLDWDTSERARSTLLKFHDKDAVVLKFSDLNLYMYSHYSRLLNEAIEDGASVNGIDDRGNNVVKKAIYCSDFDLFTLVWARIDHRILTTFDEPLLLFTARYIRYVLPRWYDFFYLMLSSPAAKELIADAKARSKCGSCISEFFISLINGFQTAELGHEKRLVLLYMVLSIDSTVDEKCAELIHQYYGFNEEFEAIIYCAEFCTRHRYNNPLDFRVAYFLCAGNEGYNINQEVFKFLKTAVGSAKPKRWLAPKNLVYLLGFCSLSPCMKDELIFTSSNSDHIDASKINKRIEGLPKVPTLVELSRNQTRTFIRQKFKVEKPHHFYNGLEQLCLPKRIVDIICFKQPLY